ncbi:hypothetical protein KAW38_01320 [Candidatus Micrarchaeota archaeon]|nr:hypothetical protein [Candidatus Micrarchaeota archaeon]
MAKKAGKVNIHFRGPNFKGMLETINKSSKRMDRKAESFITAEITATDENKIMQIKNGAAKWDINLATSGNLPLNLEIKNVRISF